jgi:outer membrane protein TolC
VKKLLLLSSTLFVFNTSIFAREAVTLKDYLSRIEANNHEVKAADLGINALEKKMSELDIAYTPFASFDASYIIDKSGVGFGSTLPTQEMRAATIDAGFNKKWETGSALSAGLSASEASFDLYYPYEIFPSQFLTDFAGYQVRPFVRFDQSLLKEFGKNGQSRSGIKKVKSSMNAAIYLRLFSRQQVLLKARAAYLSLSLAREVVAFRQSSLERAQKVLDWTEKRYKLDLVDQADLLQSRAALKLRQLNLQAAVQDELTALGNFNELLGVNGKGADYDLENISDLLNSGGEVETLSRSGKRADVFAASNNYESARFANKEAYLRSGPELGAFGMTSLNGVDLSASNAFSQVIEAQKPMFTFGINYVIPLDFSNVSTTRKGYEQDEKAALESVTETEISAEHDWAELNKNWANVRLQLQLSQEIKNIQEARVNAEQQKFQRGRTTTFNVLNAENDLDDATLNVYRLSLQQLIYASQAELYNTQPLTAVMSNE